MSDFFISGFTDGDSSAGSMPAPADWRANELAQHAFVALSRFEFGAVDARSGKRTQAVMDLAEALRRGAELSHARARQRAHAYWPVAGREHCPHCWVFTGFKRMLDFEDDGGLETARCADCSRQFQIAPQHEPASAPQ